MYFLKQNPKYMKNIIKKNSGEIKINKIAINYAIFFYFNAPIIYEIIKNNE